MPRRRKTSAGKKNSRQRGEDGEQDREGLSTAQIVGIVVAGVGVVGLGLALLYGSRRQSGSKLDRLQLSMRNEFVALRKKGSSLS